MNEHSDNMYLLSEFFKVFGDLTRIKIIKILLNNEMCVCDIAKSLNMGQSAISHQLRILRASSLVRVRKNGKESFYSLDDDHIKTIFKLGLEHIMEGRANFDC